MPNVLKGVSIYMSAEDIVALDHAHDHLYTIREATSAAVPELSLAMDGVRRLLDKARKAHASTKRRKVIAEALKVAQS